MTVNSTSVPRPAPDRTGAANLLQPVNQVMQAATGGYAAVVRRRHPRRTRRKTPAIVLDDKAEAGRLHLQLKTYLGPRTGRLVHAARRLELGLRDLKTTLGMDQLHCKSPDMAEKELLAYLVAHNLIRCVMAEAVAQYAVDLAGHRNPNRCPAVSPDSNSNPRLANFIADFARFRMAAAAGRTHCRWRD
jgi:hypothetical protein